MDTWTERMLARRPWPAVGFLMALLYALVLTIPQLVLSRNLIQFFPVALQPWLQMFTNVSVWALVPTSIAVWLLMSLAVDTCLTLMSRAGDSRRIMEVYGYAQIPAILFGAVAGFLLLWVIQTAHLPVFAGEDGVLAFTQALQAEPLVQLGSALSLAGLQVSLGFFAYLVAVIHRVRLHVGFAAVLIPAGLWWLLTMGARKMMGA